MDLVNTNQPFYSTLSKLVIPVAAKLVYTPINVFVLIDKVIVYKLIYTYQAFPATVDLSSNPYSKNTPLLFLFIYTFLPYNTYTNTPFLYT